MSDRSGVKPPVQETYSEAISVYSQPPRSTQPGHRFVGIGAMSSHLFQLNILLKFM